jgi:acetyl esterase/lipase
MTAAAPPSRSRSVVSSLIVERPNRASIATRVAHPLLAGHDRIGIVRLDSRRWPSPLEQLCRFGRLLDRPAALLVAPHRTKRVKVQAGHWRAGWLRHRDLPDPRHTQQAGLLYFNGGGYICGGLNTHRRLVAKLAHASRIPAFKVDYRQLLHAHITDTPRRRGRGVSIPARLRAERIIVPGDSAGGGLAFRLMLATRERGYRCPSRFRDRWSARPGIVAGAGPA